MATPIGVNDVTAIARHFIMPTLVDNVYNGNPVWFRMNQSKKKQIQGGTQLEVPLMYARFGNGGPYSGYDVLNTTPPDTVKNAAFDWKQHYVTVAIDGLTMIKTDSPDAIANFVEMYFAQAEMEMAENLGVGLWSDGTTNTKDVDGLKGAIDDSSVLGTYGGIARASNTWWKSQVDSTTTTLALTPLNAMFMNCSNGGRHPSLIASRREQYNRFWNLNVINQQFVTQAAGHDEQLASAGFTNQLFNGVPWVVDPHVFDGPNTSNSAITFLNEDYFWWGVSPRADFYLEDFQTPIQQDAMVAKLLWAGNLMVTNVSRQGKMTAIAA